MGENVTSVCTVEPLDCVEASILLLLSLSSFSLNTFVVVVYVSSRKLRENKHNIYIMSLVIYDLFYAMFIMPVSFAYKICVLSSESDGILCEITGFMSVLTSTSAVFTLCGIAIDRFYATLSPIEYTQLSKRKCRGAVVICWAAGAVIATIPLFPDMGARYQYDLYTRHCSPTSYGSCFYFTFGTIVGYVIPVAVMSFCYLKIYRRIRAQRRKVADSASAQTTSNIIADDITTTAFVTQLEVNHIQLHPKPVRQVSRPTNISARDKLVAIRGAVLIVSFFGLVSVYSMTHICQLSVDWPEWLGASGMIMLYVFSMVNPVLYVFNNNVFKKETSKLLKKLRRE